MLSKWFYLYSVLLNIQRGDKGHRKIREPMTLFLENQTYKIVPGSYKHLTLPPTSRV